jgi:hypothetical protein
MLAGASSTGLIRDHALDLDPPRNSQSTIDFDTLLPAFRCEPLPASTEVRNPLCFNDSQQKDTIDDSPSA